MEKKGAGKRASEGEHGLMPFACKKEPLGS